LRVMGQSKEEMVGEKNLSNQELLFARNFYAYSINPCTNYNSGQIKCKFMKITTLFVILQYICGFAFAATSIFLFIEISHLELNAGIFLGFLIGFIGMITGVEIVGYFHLRVKHIRRKFRLTLVLSSLGLLAFLFLYIVIEKYLSNQLRLLILFSL
jgi:hypothetical protein